MRSANDCSIHQPIMHPDKKPHNIIVENKIVIFKESDKNLLVCLENADVDVHYHCRDGFCGACRVTLVEGEIYYPQGNPLAFVGDGEILTCCCIPKSDIKLLID